MLKRLLSQVGSKRTAPSSTLSDALQAAPAKDWKVRFGAPPIEDLTILVPFLPDRVGFLESMLEHFDQAGLELPILMSVSHDGDEHGPLQSVLARHPKQRVTVFFHAKSMPIFDRLLVLAKEAKTRYVFIHSDDDFVVPSTLAQSVHFLNENADYVACQGRVAFFRLKSGGAFAVAQTGETLSEDSLAQRMLHHCSDFSTTFHAVTRRQSFIDAHELAVRRTENIIFLQYLASCAVLSLGKLKTFDEIFYLRLDNPHGERAILIRGRDKTHWPYLIIAENFSEELKRFRSGLNEASSRQGQTLDEKVLDDCCLTLVRRAFGIMRTGPAPEYPSIERLQTENTLEHAFLRHCATLSLVALKAPFSAVQ